MVFYFTATGNSLSIARMLEENPISIAQAVHAKEKVFEGDTIGVVCPVFGHEMPKIVKEFLETSTFHTPYFYILLTYGNRHGGASELAEKYMDEIGKQVSYINVIKMVDNYLPAFDMEEQKKIDKKVEEQFQTIQKDIEEKKQSIAKVTDADRKAHREFLERIRNAPKDAFSNLYYITKDCIGCGICAKVCPEKCFTVQNQKSTWNAKKCITCFACIHACPMKAIQLNIKEKNPNARYRNEAVSICDIIESNNQFKD